MSYQQPRGPGTIEDLLGDALRLYRASFALVWLPNLLIVLAGAVSTGVANGVLRARVGDDPALFDLIMAVPQVLIDPRVLGSTAIDLLMYAWGGYAVLATMHAVVDSHALPATQGLAQAARALPVALLSALLFLSACLLGLGLLIVPGVYVWGMLQFWLNALVDGPLGPVSAFARSWRLVRGHWWRSVTVLGLGLPLALLIEVLVGVALGMLAKLGVAAHVWRSVRPGASIAESTLVDAVAHFLVQPLYFAILVSVYQDLKRRATADPPAEGPGAIHA